MFSSSLEIGQAPFETVADWGTTLCVAPHPDDEALGCGGTLALLARGGARVGIAWVSDGGLSHPNSRSYPRPRLAALRETEALLSARELGARHTFFQRLPDGELAWPDEADFSIGVEGARQILAQFQPQTLLLPWRRDPHRDHRASWLMWATAAQHLQLRRLEYLVWAFERAAPGEWPRADEARAFRVDIGAVAERKSAAIAAHQSQVSDLIGDDPMAFRLSPEVLAHFAGPFESWLAPFDNAPERGWTRRPEFENSP